MFHKQEIKTFAHDRSQHFMGLVFRIPHPSETVATPVSYKVYIGVLELGLPSSEQDEHLDEETISQLPHLPFTTCCSPVIIIKARALFTEQVCMVWIHTCNHISQPLLTELKELCDSAPFPGSATTIPSWPKKHHACPVCSRTGHSKVSSQTRKLSRATRLKTILSRARAACCGNSVHPL